MHTAGSETNAFTQHIERRYDCCAVLASRLSAKKSKRDDRKISSRIFLRRAESVAPRTCKRRREEIAVRACERRAQEMKR